MLFYHKTVSADTWVADGSELGPQRPVCGLRRTDMNRSSVPTASHQRCNEMVDEMTLTEDLLHVSCGQTWPWSYKLSFFTRSFVGRSPHR